MTPKTEEARKAMTTEAIAVAVDMDPLPLGHAIDLPDWTHAGDSGQRRRHATALHTHVERRVARGSRTRP